MTLQMLVVFWIDFCDYFFCRQPICQNVTKLKLWFFKKKKEKSNEDVCIAVQIYTVKRWCLDEVNMSRAQFGKSVLILFALQFLVKHRIVNTASFILTGLPGSMQLCVLNWKFILHFRMWRILKYLQENSFIPKQKRSFRDSLINDKVTEINGLMIKKSILKKKKKKKKLHSFFISMLMNTDSIATLFEHTLRAHFHTYTHT